MRKRIKRGQRVRVIYARWKEGQGPAIGAIGTALETSIAPWVEFDEPQPCSQPICVWMIDGPTLLSRTGYADCIDADDLESYRITV